MRYYVFKFYKIKYFCDNTRFMEKKKNKGWRFYLIATLLFLAFLLVKRNNIVRWVQSGFTVAQQEKTIEYYKESIDRMDSQLKGLNTNLDSLETYARENFYFSEPEEDVYILNE